jgi:membrane protease YdiL (CAAX protease family)
MESQTPKQTQNEWQRTPWTNRDAWWGLLMGLGLSIIVPLVFAAVLVAFSVNYHIVESLLFPVGSLVWLVPVWWFTMRKDGTGWQDLGFRRFKGSTLGIGCGMLISFYIISAVYSAILVSLFDMEMQPDLAPIAEELLIPWLFPLAAVAIAPFTEEVFFRGFVFAGFRQRYGWRKAAIISSAIFALIHLQPLAAPPLFLLGFLFAYIYHRSNSIWLPILMHFLVNSLAMIGIYFISND